MMSHQGEGTSPGMMLGHTVDSESGPVRWLRLWSGVRVSFPSDNAGGKPHRLLPQQ